MLTSRTNRIAGAAGAVAALLCAGVPASAQITLAGGVSSESPDGRRIGVNGVFIPDAGATVGWWYYDWGDGTRNTGFFPMYHRYATPGNYTIRLVGYDDLGNTAEATAPHSVPDLPPTDVSYVVLARTFLGLQPADSRTVMLSAYDDAGTPLSLDGRLVELYAPAPDVIQASIAPDGIEITAVDSPNSETASAWVYAYVDGVECQRPLFVIVNENPADYSSVEGVHSAFYLPTWFFDTAYLSEADHATIVDLVYDEFSLLMGCDPAIAGAPAMQGVSYIPAVHGANGNPLVIGDSAAPVNGWPQLGIFFHEMGHNFHAYRMLLNSGAVSGALYQETLAEWHVQFGCNRLLDLHADELSLAAHAGLTRARDDGRAYHLWEYNNYVAGGMVFDFGTIMPSHVLVQKIYELCDLHGWDKLRTFYNLFDIPRMAALSDVYGSFGGGTDVYRLSALVAALGLTFGEDLRPMFTSLNFPIDDAFHDAVWDALVTAGADIDRDSDVDIDDFDLLAVCMSGPALAPEPVCESADITLDGAVDLSDTAVFQRAFDASGY